MLRPGDDLLERHPGFALSLLIGLTLLLLVMLAKTFQVRRDREAYIKLAQWMTAIRPDISQAYAQGFVALGWLTLAGFLLRIDEVTDRLSRRRYWRRPGH